MNILHQTKLFIEEMNKTNSTLDKKEVLKHHLEMKELLEWVYNPFKQFYVTSDVLKKKKDIVGSSFDFTLFYILELLSKRIKTGHEAIGLVNGFIEKNIEYKDIIYKIIDKDLECRIGTKVINSIFPNLIPEFEIPLANKIQDYKGDVCDGSYFWSRKLDGCLSGDTVVELEKNGKILLRNVVDNHIKDNIKCYDHKKHKSTFKKILGYGKDITINETDNKWYILTLENGIKIKATANHLFFLLDINAYRRVDQLNEGDTLLIDE